MKCRMGDSDTRVSRLVGLPYFIYRGEVLRADRETAGLLALKRGSFELDVGFSWRRSRESGTD